MSCECVLLHIHLLFIHFLALLALCALLRWAVPRAPFPIERPLQNRRHDGTAGVKRDTEPHQHTYPPGPSFISTRCAEKSFRRHTLTANSGLFFPSSLLFRWRGAVGKVVSDGKMTSKNTLPLPPFQPPSAGLSLE